MTEKRDAYSVVDLARKAAEKARGPESSIVTPSAMANIIQPKPNVPPKLKVRTDWRK